MDLLESYQGFEGLYFPLPAAMVRARAHFVYTLVFILLINSASQHL